MALDDYGITSISTSLTKSFKVRRQLSEGEVVVDEGGAFEHACAYNEEVMFDATGYGDFPADFALAGSGPTITGLSGGVSLVKNGSKRQRTGQPNEWSADGEHAPDGVAPA